MNLRSPSRQVRHPENIHRRLFLRGTLGFLYRKLACVFYDAHRIHRTHRHRIHRRHEREMLRLIIRQIRDLVRLERHTLQHASLRVFCLPCIRSCLNRRASRRHAKRWPQNHPSAFQPPPDKQTFRRPRTCESVCYIRLNVKTRSLCRAETQHRLINVVGDPLIAAIAHDVRVGGRLQIPARRKHIPARHADRSSWVWVVRINTHRVAARTMLPPKIVPFFVRQHPLGTRAVPSNRRRGANISKSRYAAGIGHAHKTKVIAIRHAIRRSLCQ